MRPLRFACVALLAGCAARAVPLFDVAPSGVPTNLRDAGLYRDWATLTVDEQNRPYTPAFALWSDGAQKTRWIQLPPGTQIDVSHPDEWIFPVGTKLWKEFRSDRTRADGSVHASARIETRLLWKRTTTHWDMVTYLWSDDEREARLADAASPPPVPLPGTAAYEVPVERCSLCHGGAADHVLGFAAALLAAPEADQAGMTWQRLCDEHLVAPEATAPASDALQFLAVASDTERRAAGYLHANCGISCHNATAAQKTPFYARLEHTAAGALPTRIEETSVFQTAVNVRSAFIPSQGKGPWYRIRPGDETRSVLYYRMGVRSGLTGGGEQMPPIDTHRLDDEGMAILRDWIRSMTQSPYPTPGP